MSKNEDTKESQKESKVETLTRRSALKRMATALAGAGIAIVAGQICKEKEALAAYFNEGYDAYASWYKK